MLGLLDTLLDRTVVPGYSKVGYALRRLTWPADDPAPGALRGRHALVTGASSGLGLATAVGLARLGAVVHAVVRDLDKGRDAVARVRGEVPGADVRLHRCDVSDLADVRRFVAGLSDLAEGDGPDRVDVLVHNAGVLPPTREESVDGHELTLATHVLGPVLMTELLLPRLRAAGSSRVVLVSSGGMYAQRLPADDPEYLVGDYAGTTAYARTKRMQVALGPQLHQRWRGEGVAVHVMHPGWADTPGVVTSLPGFHRLMGPVLRDPAAGADTVVWLAATEPAPTGGRFWMDRAPRPTHYLPRTRESASDRARLWAYVRSATELSEPRPAPAG